jgi:hypothetical protein
MSADSQSPSIYSRRAFGKLTLAALPFSLRINQRSRKRLESTIKGVRIGVQSFSFRSLPGPDEIIQAMVQIGLGSVELMSNHAETAAGAPAGAEGMRRWRHSISMDAFKGVPQKFQDAAIDITFLCYNVSRNTTDEEIEYAFLMADALSAWQNGSRRSPISTA